MRIDTKRQVCKLNNATVTRARQFSRDRVSLTGTDQEEKINYEEKILRRKDIYQRKFNSGQLTDILSREEVEAGDVFFIPAGRVHTIGAGVLLTEIQQTSDVTYRIYDFDRKDDKGNLRELHTEEALDAITYEFLPTYKTKYSTTKNEQNSILSCEYFETNKYQIDNSISFDYSQLDSFRIFICYKGKTNIKGEGFNVEMKMGDAVLIPACISNLTVEPLEESEFIETYIPS